ncbi:hypothetical protein V1514DRAFT_294149 [Lipomyces japonicus]|uniref:uncharacterized protein n=1 Tax=Lipomyces japonicus TaxID=56871 RepID=UPI0034D02078
MSEESFKVSQDVLKQLAANDRPSREAGVAEISKLLATHEEEIAAIEFLKIWKGLFYCMWMTDRVRVQQVMARKLAGIVLITNNVNVPGFVNAFWATMAREWNNIDVLRIDKYYMLIRFFVNSVFKRLQVDQWDHELLAKYNRTLIKYPLSPSDSSIADGLRYHMIDIFIDELEKSVDEFTTQQQQQKKTTQSGGNPKKSSSTTTPKTTTMTTTIKLPITTVLQPFDNLAQHSISKPIKKKVYLDVLHDARVSKIWHYKAPSIPSNLERTYAKKK